MSKKMKKVLLVFFVILTGFIALPAFSQTGDENEEDLLGLPGDNLDLYAVLDLFQKSKTIEDFQEALNAKETGINNLDLNLDGNVDFIKVVTKQKDEDFTFILQDDVSDDETQDVAVILLSKDKDANVTLQIVGDEALYGKNFVVEPAPPVTPNPAYTGDNPVTVSSDATNVVVVQSAPIVQYVYSPVYVPYYPPYYYGYYPPYFFAFSVMAVGIYRHNNYYYHHGGYHGGYGHTTVVVHNHNTYNNYHNTRNISNTVNRNNAGGNYNKGNRPSNGNAAKPSTRPSNPSAATRPSKPSASTRPSNPSASTRPSNPSATTRPSNPSTSTRQSPSTRPTTNNYSGGGRAGGGNSGGGGGRAGNAGGVSRGGRR